MPRRQGRVKAQPLILRRRQRPKGNKMEEQQSSNAKIIIICLLAAIAGLMFGLDTAVIGGAKQFVIEHFGLSYDNDAFTVGALVSAITFGAAIGSVLAGLLASGIGRKRSLQLAALIFIIGELVSAFSQSIWVLIGARAFLGLAVGIASYATPLYLAEIAPQKIRGSMISFYQFMITSGLLLAYLSDTYFAYHFHDDPSTSWRWMVGIVAVPAVVLFFGVLFIPRSPRWLASKGRKEEAQQVLERIRRSKTEADAEMGNIEQSLQEKQNGWGLFKANRNFRRSVGLGMLLQIMQQVTGINIVLYYAPEIIKMAGFDQPAEQMWGSVLVALINVLATFIAIAVVDRWGRRPILLTGYLIMAVAMAVMGILIHANTGGYIALAMLAIFIIGFAASAGPLAWVLCSEIQPTKGRNFGATISTTTNWIMNLILTFTFVKLLTTLGNANTFWLYAVLNLICIGLIWRFVPETKGVSLEEIEANLMAGKELRDIGENLDAKA